MNYKNVEEDFIFDPNVCYNEREVESKLIVSYLLPKLGYDIRMWRQETKEGKLRLDFLAYSNQADAVAPKIVIEAKHPKIKLVYGRYQLKRYMVALQIDYGLLTNGRHLIIYKRCLNNIELVFECQVENLPQQLDNIRALIGRQQLITYKPSTNELLKESSLQYTKDTMKILAIFHNKGGVGKTTTTVNLADAIARTGKRVLIIDIDSQANATFATGLMNFSDESSDDIKNKYIYHLLHFPKFFPIDDVARKARYTNQNVDVLPSHIQLMEAEPKLNTLPFVKSTNGILLKKLKESKKTYDVVLIDTPPSLNLYAQISLLTADYLLIPSDLKVFANEGLHNVKELIEHTDEAKEMSGLPTIKVLGILPTKILSNPRYIENLKTQRIPKIEATYGFPVLKDHMIIERLDLARCIDQHVEVGDLDIPDPKSIFEYNPTSPATGEFEQLANYVLQQMGLPI